MTLWITRTVRVIAVSMAAALTIKSMAWAEDYQATCRYFSNQAFQDRHVGEGSTFRTQLAKDCIDARSYSQSKNIEVKVRAEKYLAQLNAYRGVIARMMIDRTRVHGTSAEDGDHRRYARPAVSSVSGAGAYLIARDMGLFETHETWTIWRKSLVLADPRFRID